MIAPAAALRAAVLIRRHTQHGPGRSLRPLRAMASSGPSAIWADVQRATERAAGLGAVFSIDTGTEVVTDARSGVQARAGARAAHLRRRADSLYLPCPQFVVRVAKALRDKPKADMPAGGAPKPPAVNPFLPYDEALYVRHLVRHRAACPAAAQP